MADALKTLCADLTEEGLFASWPRVITPDGEDGDWLMTYHAFNGSCWNVYSAESSDAGLSWARRGRVLGPGGDGAFDSSGIGTRATCAWRGQWLMVYEGVDGVFSGLHRLGVATSDDAGRSWTKMAVEGTADAGGPIVSPGEPGAWTAGVVGTPYLVPLDGGGLRLYFCAKDGLQMNMSIGLVESASGDVTPGSWRAVC